jgi:hypothetical protein
MRFPPLRLVLAHTAALHLQKQTAAFAKAGGGRDEFDFHRAGLMLSSRYYATRKQPS